jgi:hypothetical protein
MRCFTPVSFNSRPNTGRNISVKAALQPGADFLSFDAAKSLEKK